MENLWFFDTSASRHYKMLSFTGDISTGDIVAVEGNLGTGTAVNNIQITVATGDQIGVFHAPALSTVIGLANTPLVFTIYAEA